MSDKDEPTNSEELESTGSEKKGREEKEKSRHHSSSRSSRHSSKEKLNFTIKIDVNNFTINPNLYKNITDYEKICQIGKGSYSKIYKYKNKETEEIVAIKRMFSDDKEIFFGDQVKILSFFRHPTINQLLGIIDDKEEDMKRIITPFYSNGNLQRIIEKKKIIPEGWDFTQKYIVLYGIAVGMAILHKNNFLHRDLKPSSILITDQLEPIINNFDISIHINQENGKYKPTSFFGTPLFTSPEIFKLDFDDGNTEINGKKADVYSYSMICYFLLTEIQPFNDFKNISALYNAITKGIRPEFPQDFDVSIRKIIELCWDEDPSERPLFDQIIRKLSDRDFIKNIQDLDYKRVRRYQKRITPKEFLEENENDDLDRSRRHRLSSRKSKHSSKVLLINEKDNFVINVDRNKLTVNPKFYKNLLDYEEICIISNFITKYKNKSTNEIVLIKRHVFSDDDQDSRKRIKIILNLSHPVLSPILGLLNSLEVKEANLILPFYEKDLLDIIKNKGEAIRGWDFTQKYIVLYGIAVGLAILNKNHLFHQNLKPKSIFISERLEPIIGNYDSPTYIQKRNMQSDLSNNENNENKRPKELSDTYLFIAPELIGKEENVDFDGEPANVYSFAMICYQLLTGITPFSNIKSHLSLFNTLLKGEKPEIPKELNQSLHELIEQCWNQDPTKRPQFEEIILKLSKKEFIENIEGLNYKRICSYIKRITPDEFLDEKNEEQEDLTSSKQHHSKRSSRRSSRHLSREKVHLALKVDPSNFMINPSLYKNLSDFEKIEKIGSGTSSEVYKCRNKKTNEIIAIKQGQTDDTKFSNYFYIEEIKILSLFNNPTLNKLYGIIEKNDEIYIITSLYPNGDLLHMMEKSKENPPENWDYTQKYIILYGIAIGMSILHKNNFLHRDLKPASILLSDQLEPTISNFNSSILINDKDGNYKPEDYTGNPFFTPLEAIKFTEEKNVTEINGKKVDVYSYAMICYQLLTDLTPFANLQNQTRLKSFLSKGERPEIPKEINQIFRQLIEKCWNQEPNERPSFEDIVLILGDKDLIKSDENLDYKRVRKYQWKVTPKALIEALRKKRRTKQKEKKKQNEACSEINNENNNDNDNDNDIIINIDFTNFNYDQSLNKDISKFNRLGKIGEGGHAKVFKYQEIESGKFFAGKKAKENLEDKNIQREIMISSNLHHPTLQPLYGISINDDLVVLFTPYCSKGDLSHMIESENKNEAPKEWNRTQKYIVMYGVAAGMYVLHNNNFIHRDLKPGNVVISDNLEPIITDFGCSKQIDQANMMYQTGIIGTPAFMAPEIISNEDLEYDGKMADVYAYAVLCYQLFTGIVPFKNIKNPIQMMKLLEKQVRPEFPERFNKSVKEFIEGCWKQIPEDRFTFEEILNILGDQSFIEKVGGININKFREYQMKVVSKKFRQTTFDIL